MKTIIKTIAALLAMSVHAGAEGPEADPADIAVAQDVVTICASLMPNNLQVENAVLELGFATDRWNGRFHMMESTSGGVLVVISGEDTYDKHCAILVSGLSVEQANSLVAPWLEHITAAPAEVGDSKALAMWSGSSDGVIARVSVFETSPHDQIKGAWVRLVLTDKPV